MFTDLSILYDYVWLTDYALCRIILYLLLDKKQGILSSTVFLLDKMANFALKKNFFFILPVYNLTYFI